jgi:hypothetical protein
VIVRYSGRLWTVQPTATSIHPGRVQIRDLTNDHVYAWADWQTIDMESHRQETCSCMPRDCEPGPARTSGI